MDWLQIDIYNLLLDYVESNIADEITDKVMDRIKNPQNTIHELSQICEED